MDASVELAGHGAADGLLASHGSAALLLVVHEHLEMSFCAVVYRKMRDLDMFRGI